MNKALNSVDIFLKLKKDEYSKETFKGVFPRDKIPKHLKYPCSLVVNTDGSNKPGQHWLALFYNEQGSCTFFDSFGLPPSFYGFEDYLEKTSTKWSHNSQRLQDFLTSTCGYYCIYFILLKSRGFELNEILDLFDKKKFLFNDFKIVNL